MGGFGSGWRGASKTTVEDCLVLSSSKLMRDGMLRPNLWINRTLTWTDTHTGEKLSSVGYAARTERDHGWIRLHFTRSSDGEKVDLSIDLTTTNLPWRRLRWWFVCPLRVGGRACGRRVGKLYLPPAGRFFGCRHCYDLTYTSCKESHKFDRVLSMVGAPMGLSASDVARLLKQRFKLRQ
jgi:hypothetical protein